MSKELGWWGRWWKGKKTKQEEMLILKTESRNARGMERDGSLAVLRRETEEKERQQMGYRERESVRVLFHCSLWCGDILGGSQRDVSFQIDLFSVVYYFCRYLKPLSAFFSTSLSLGHFCSFDGN